MKWVVMARRADHSGKHRGFRHAQIVDFLAEVHLCSRRKAGRSRTKVDVVQVARQNLVLCQMMLDPDRDRRLPEFALVGAFRTEKENLDELLSDRAAAGNDFSGFDILPERA